MRFLEGEGKAHQPGCSERKKTISSSSSPDFPKRNSEELERSWRGYCLFGNASVQREEISQVVEDGDEALPSPLLTEKPLGD